MPYALYPIPYTLYPVPCTLHPTGNLRERTKKQLEVYNGHLFSEELILHWYEQITLVKGQGKG